MNAVILARVSTKDQEDTNSIPSQTRRLREYAERCDLEIIDTYQLVESSTKSNRKKFNELITKARKFKQTTAIIADTVDRIQRDFRESVMLDELRREGKIELHFVREGLVISKNSNSSEIMRWDMAVMFAKSYVTQLSDNVKRSFEQKVKNGEWLSKAPYGYRNVDMPDGKKWIEHDGIYAEIISNMYRWYATGSYSMKEIQKKLVEEYKVEMGISLIGKIYSNPFYYGVMIIKEEEYAHKYDPIVSKEMYDKVRTVIAGFNKKSFKYAGLPFAYRGLIRCAVCACSVSPERGKGHHYYHCTEFKGKHKTPYVREEDLTKQFQKAFQALVLTPENYARVSQALRDAHADKVKYKSQHVAHLNTELTKYQKRLDKLYEDHLDGVVDDVFYKRKASEYKALRDSIKNKLNATDKADDAFYLTIDNMLRLAQKAPSLLLRSEMEYARRLINFVLQNLTLKDRKLRWEYKKPFDILAKTAKNDNWQGHVESNHDLGFWRPLY